MVMIVVVVDYQIKEPLYLHYYCIHWMDEKVTMVMMKLGQ
jgi:hypothetical protein